MATGTTAPAAPEPYKWTDEDTEVFVRWRVAHKAMFSGGRTANPLGFKKFLEERGLVGRVTTGYLKKKWENLKQKYKLQRRYLEVLPPALDSPSLVLQPRRPLGTGRLPGSKATAASWKWFDLMHEALGARPSVAPPVVIATCAPGTVVSTSTATSERVNHGEAGETGQAAEEAAEGAAEETASGSWTPASSRGPTPKKRRVDIAEALQELRGQDEQEWRMLQDEEKKREERREEVEERRYREMSEREERYHQKAAEREERWREEMRARDERYHQEAVAREERWREETRARDERRDQEAAARDNRFLDILEMLAKR